MHASIKAIAGVYALLGVASTLWWLYNLFTGFDPTYGILNGPWFLALAYGLVTFRPWARTLGMVTSSFFGFLGFYILITWSHALVKRPVAALFVVALLIAFSAWQWWVFSRPQVRHLYSSKSA
jgi:hypothetical protein